jgi:peroxiredoxin
MTDNETRQTAPLPPGTEAPDFQLHDTPDQTVSLSEFRGRPVVLAFYPADWSPVCSDQMVLYTELLPEFEKYNAQVLGLSVDGAWCHLAFAKHRNIRFPLLADFEPKGKVSRDYRAFRGGEGVSERVLFVVEPQGKIFWSYRSPIGVNPGADGILRALDEMTKSKALA